jgi:hypothetical protein
LDGVLCLLLISAAVVTVTGTTPDAPTGEGRAGDVASTLATTTTAVNYTLTPRTDATGVSIPNDGESLERSAHGTLAELLARTVVGRITVDGRRLSNVRDGFGQAVGAAVEAAVRANHTRVTATWRPYPDASVRGRFTVGARPPPDVPVHAAVLSTPSGFSQRSSATADTGGDRNIDAVADVVASTVIDGLFPPTRTRIAAGGSSSALVRHRYRRAEHRLGVDRHARLADGGVDTANDRLAAALSRRVSRDLRRANVSIRSVDGRVRLGRVRITVRTWP